MAAVPSGYAFSQLYVGGTWRSGHTGEELDVRDPYSGQSVARISKADMRDVELAYRCAQSTQPGWANALPVQRADVFRRVAQVMERRHGEIVDWLIRESGSTRTKAEIEWGAVHASMLEASTLPSRLEGQILAGDYPGKENRVYRVPVGVVTVISPWNWPLHLSVRSVAPALALGNAVVLKPASETPVTGGLLIARMFEEAGLPPGVLNVLVGDNQTIGDGLVQHPVPRVVSFTGSTRVGRHIGQLAAAAPTIKKAMLELGGNGPLVVLDDVDLDHAVHQAGVAKFLHQGQMCIAANRIIVVAPIYEAFVDRFLAYARTLKVGDPNDPDTVIGPIISRRQLDSLNVMVDIAKTEGARLRLGQPAQGLVLPPHVFDRVTPSMALGRHEIFGPIAPLMRAGDEHEALQMANDTEYGLTSAVLSGDTYRAERFAQGVQAGMTHVNDITAIDMPALPFGGEKNSGIGRFGSTGMIQAFTRAHWISIQHTRSAYPF
ncbi:MAG TPA: aldehyde dehydrogenase family protein [Frateuria sp.]|uniref:aldehyde dehydrogenase family protein n=1 Tax=Frateuria sp. TaxID=2211372 RepID=UPI002D7E9737|nr:aldehyde dehydrogenase family protein [Frateuria sp.]HET6803934.1 aldehyde dehydrogenase family protein [Frateuria sp.]